MVDCHLAARARLMPRFSAHLTRLFTELPFAERFAAAAAAGFPAVEYVSPGTTSDAEVAARLGENGLRLALFNVATGDASRGDRGLAAQPDRRAEFDASITWAKGHAAATGARRVHLMAGNGDRRDPRLMATYRDNIRRAADALGPLGVSILLEPINRRDMPDYFLDDYDVAAEVIDGLGLPNVRLMFDVYHRQIIHGDVIMGLRQFWPIVGHVQIASVPSRQEPDLEELRYEAVFEELDRLGYDGFVGCEYTPRAGTLEGLSWFTPYAQR
jgi:hydroxypyruvate isomerase